MLAAIQAPVIMMSQNRQAVKDRLDTSHDYEVNLKAEMEIANLHAKVDELSEKQWSELVEMQKEQIRLLTRLLEESNRKQNSYIKTPHASTIHIYPAGNMHGISFPHGSLPLSPFPFREPSAGTFGGDLRREDLGYCTTGLDAR